MAIDASITLGSLDLTSAPYLWEFGSTLGKPELVTEALEQQLQDGEVVSATRASNREIVVTVLVEATNLATQADAESALALECAKERNTLTYNPGGGAAPTVFDTFVADMAFERDDEMEMAGYRRWTLTIPALPYARSSTAVTTAIPAPPASVTTTLVDDGSALTNWAVDTGWSLAVASGAIVPTSAVTRTNMFTDPSTEYDASHLMQNETGGWVAQASMPSPATPVPNPGTHVAERWTGSSGFSTSPGPATIWTSAMSVTVGQTYTGSAYLRSTVSRSARMSLVWVDGAFTPVGAAANGALAATPVGSWTRYSVTGTAPAGAVYVQVVFTWNSTGVNEYHWADAMLLEKSNTLGTYFDGSTPSGTEFYTWSGAAHQSVAFAYTAVGHVMRSSLAVSTTGKPYLRVALKDPAGGPGRVPDTVKVNGTTVTLVASSGLYQWYDVSAIATINTVELDYSMGAAPNTFEAIDELVLTNATRLPSTGRETSRVATVRGSARTQASLSIADTTPAALGSVLVYTSPVIASMAQPALRDFLQAGPTITTDATTVSGSTSPLSTAHSFDIPATGIQPGGHLLLARVKNTATGTYALAWTAKSRLGSTDVDTGQSGSASVALTANTWAIVTVGLMNLPTRKLGSSGKVRVTLSAPANTTLDEAWLFNVDTGRLTWVEAGTGAPAAGGPASRLWIDAASLANPEPSITLGTAADRSDEMGAGEKVVSFGVHDFVPPQVNVFIVTSGSTAAAVNLVHYPRWHTHVGSAA